MVYGALAFCVTAGYILVVVFVGGLVGTSGERNLWLSLLATALVAVAFEPLRERLQLVANRLVYGHRASPYEVLASFSRRVGEVFSVDEVLPRMAEAAARGVGAASSQVRVFLADGLAQAVTWPADVVESEFQYTMPVMHQGELVGEIAVSMLPGESLRVTEKTLLADLASGAGLALSNVRLGLELRARLAELAAQTEELRASRQRIVAAQDVERRRIERDLHDGVQQQLVALGIQLRLLGPLMAKDPKRAAELIEDLVLLVNEAVGELRDLARGIFPSLLADRGVVVAIRAYLDKVQPAVRFEADPSLVKVRLAPDLETAVYFCVREALQNAAKHAAGAPVSVQLSEEGGWLLFSVRDEGPGFAPSRDSEGTGLQSMADRLASAGGVLEIRSSPEQGTSVIGRIPLE